MIRLLDGFIPPIDDTAKVNLMAAILVEEDAFRSPDDAKDALKGKFPMVEIIVHNDNARQVAMQSVVAREMSAADD